MDNVTTIPILEMKHLPLQRNYWPPSTNNLMVWIELDASAVNQVSEINYTVYRNSIARIISASTDLGLFRALVQFHSCEGEIIFIYRWKYYLLCYVTTTNLLGVVLSRHISFPSPRFDI